MHTFIAFTPRTIHTISLTNHSFLFFNRTTSQNSIEVFHQCESWDQWSKLRWGFCVFFYYRYKMWQSQSSENGGVPQTIVSFPFQSYPPQLWKRGKKDQFAPAVTNIVLYWKLSHWNTRDEKQLHFGLWKPVVIYRINFETLPRYRHMIV